MFYIKEILVSLFIYIVVLFCIDDPFMLKIIIAMLVLGLNMFHSVLGEYQRCNHEHLLELRKQINRLKRVCVKE